MILDASLQEAWTTLSHLPPARGTVAGYTGSARLVEADDDTHTAILHLHGHGPHGPQTATVTARLEPFGEKARLEFAIEPQPGNVQAFKATLAAALAKPSAPRPPGPRMKPAPFEYVAVTSIREGIRELRREGAVIIAGGQSLVPALNRREARPQLLVDINPIATLGVLRRTNGSLHIGATVRQAALERSPLIHAHWPCCGRLPATSATPRPVRGARCAARSHSKTPALNCRSRCRPWTRASSPRGACSPTSSSSRASS